MPTYKFLNTQTNEEFTEFMTISECDSYLKDNPHIQQMVHGAPLQIDSYRLGRRKPSGLLRDKYKEMAKNNPNNTLRTDISQI